jgi:hypothetical protein
MITESIAGRAPTGTLVPSSLGVPGIHDTILRAMRLRLAPKHPAGRHWPIAVALTRGADGWALVDPNTAPLRGLPREDRDLFIPTSNGHVLASAIVMPHAVNGPPR